MLNIFKQAKKTLKLKSQRKKYSESVKEYLNANREEFLQKWSDACERTSGRISYKEMIYILGPNYPKAPWISESDIRAQMINFFMEVGIPCKSDDTHIYFP